MRNFHQFELESWESRNFSVQIENWKKYANNDSLLKPTKRKKKCNNKGNNVKNDLVEIINENVKCYGTLSSLMPFSWYIRILDRKGKRCGKKELKMNGKTKAWVNRNCG